MATPKPASTEKPETVEVDGLLVTPPYHHVSQRAVCCACGSRVFTFATVEKPGEYEKHYCTADYHRIRRNPICMACQREIDLVDGQWKHRVHTNHEATPEVIPGWDQWRRTNPHIQPIGQES